jgi:hypothetical protein
MVVDMDLCVLFCRSNYQCRQCLELSCVHGHLKIYSEVHM